MKINKKLIALGLSSALASTGAMIAVHEGYMPGTYVDPVGILTSCFGHTGAELRKNQTYTYNQCIEQLASDLVVHDKQMLKHINVPLSDEEHAAYLSFVYNVGVGNFESSTLLKKLNGRDRVGACEQLTKWVYAKGVKLKGLVKRRSEERALCLSGNLNFEGNK